MKKSVFLLLSVVITATTIISCTGETLDSSETQPAKTHGSLTCVGDIDVISLYGTWEEMGEQYGELAAGHLSHVQDFLLDIIDGDSSKKDSIMKMSRKLFSRYPYRFRQFFLGMEKTSRLTMDQLMMNNAVEYSEGFFCSGIAAWYDYASGNLVYGRNYDATSYAPIAKDIIVTVFHPSDGSLATATIGYAGELYVVNAINETGLFLELNNGMPTAGYDLNFEQFSTTTALLEVMFEAYTLDYLDAFFKTNRSFGSFIIGAADENEARSYETCATGVENATGANPSGLMVQTNYFVSPNWTYPTPTDENSWNAITRRNNLLSLAESNKGNIDEETMCRIIATPMQEGGAMQDCTRYQLVYTPRTMKLLIRVEKGATWTEVNMRDFLN